MCIILSTRTYIYRFDRTFSLGDIHVLNRVTRYHWPIFLAAMKGSQKSEIRAYIKARGALKIPAIKIRKELCDIYGSSAVSLITVRRWLNKFQNGKTSVEDSDRSGRPRFQVSEANIAAVKKLVEGDARYTVKDIAGYVGISSAAAHKILTHHLGLRKLCARWVPHLLTKEQKTHRVKCARELLKTYKNCANKRIFELLTGDETWIYYFEPQRKIKNKVWIDQNRNRPIIAKRSQSAKKVLYAIFFNCHGPVVQVATPSGRSITGTFYKNNVLKKVKNYYLKRRPKTGIRHICLIHDNAPAHKSKIVQDYLLQETINQLPHPPYSPDLSPCDFFLFPRLKKMLSGRRYNSRNALGSAIYQCLNSIPKADYFSAFRSWIARLEKCVSVKGEYFEGMK